MVSETDARAVLHGERIDYWLSVGAQPSDKVAVLIKKYGTNGTHLDEQKAAVERLATKRRRPSVPTDLPKMEKVTRKKKDDKKTEEVVAESASASNEADVVPTEVTPVESAQTESETVST